MAIDMMSEITPYSIEDSSEKLSEIFARINMSELPALSSHVTELIALTSDGHSSANELAEIILKDYSLTNKVLQVVNSAFYALPQPVTSITRAITHLGFDAIRDLAIPIALFEDFIKSGVDKDGITKILSCSFISALCARRLVQEKGLKVPSEEVFVCALFRNLGKMIVCIYFPDLFREIDIKMSQGMKEDEAAQSVLEGLTLSQVGIEIATFWNLSGKVISSMTPDPPPQEAINEELGLLNNLADFTNRLVDGVALEMDTRPLMDKYAPLFFLTEEEVIDLLKTGIQTAQAISSPVRYGLGKLKMQNKVVLFEFAIKNRGFKSVDSDVASPEIVEEQVMTPRLTVIDEYIDNFMLEMTELLEYGSYNLNEFYLRLLEGFCQGIGYDRAILALIKVHSARVSLIGKIGYGELNAEFVANFRQDLYSSQAAVNPAYVIPKALKSCKDLAIPANTPNVFPPELDTYVKDRNVYLLPVCLKAKPLGLFYLDRRMELSRPDSSQLNATRQIRDLAVAAIRRKQEQEEG